MRNENGKYRIISLFNAICDATTWNAGWSIGISVKSFEKAMLSAAADNGKKEDLL